MPAPDDPDAAGYLLLIEFHELGFRTIESPPLSRDDVAVVKAFLARLRQPAPPDGRPKPFIKP